jgi:hypothetical protein
MIIKTGKEGSLNPILNKDKLDSIEKRELTFFEKYYFANKEKLLPRRKEYYDSMVKEHPELLSVTHYKKHFMIKQLILIQQNLNMILK